MLGLVGFKLRSLSYMLTTVQLIMTSLTKSKYLQNVFISLLFLIKIGRSQHVFGFCGGGRREICTFERSSEISLQGFF